MSESGVLECFVRVLLIEFFDFSNDVQEPQRIGGVSALRKILE
jgi:hypothetical protein